VADWPNVAEQRRLEAEADALLKEDARRRGFIRPNGRGFSDYAREIGITTKKTLETTYKHEKVGFTEQQLESLSEVDQSIRRSSPDRSSE
jgi:hypothetical protein